MCPQWGSEGHVYPQNLSAPSVSGSGGSGGQQPALSAEERHHPENIQWGDGSYTPALPLHRSQASGSRRFILFVVFRATSSSFTRLGISVFTLQDALVNLIRRARPVFLQCVNAKMDGGTFDIPALRVQLHSTQILSALQLYRTGLLVSQGSV